MCVHSDQRNVPALDRIGDPDDIIASVLVRDGRCVAGYVFADAGVPRMHGGRCATAYGWAHGVPPAATR